ncbi:MAG TPA: Rrf2 family transcriptional regulator [Chitinophaga sp.]|jgi:Rrf2 family protein|uniref:RrF2 family transcriptional regulator n=1 Tax=Chitinophaga sp. TaxID=1869181 RepID=UPI002DC04580|nr:Rrf2 family transcriptional regulator [Chitinophaga sp.]HEU4552836.1 Rrf2 family transcriptional regulator [Chitinophaga sp.]
MFSKTCEYAIRALIFIAQQSKDDVRVGVKEIAKGIGSPEHFIAKILQELSRKGLVLSLKGPTGGFYLDNKTLKCTLADIVKAVDGDKLFLGCGLGLEYCSDARPCPVHHEFKKIRADIYKTLQSIRLGEFHAQLEESIGFLKR